MTDHSPRPQQLVSTSADIAAAVKPTETQDTFKVYRKEFQARFVATTHEQASAYFEEHFAGRVHPDDVMIAAPYPESANIWLYVRTWNVAGEFKTYDLAHAHATTLIARDPYLEVEIVGRNTRAEVLLKEYGVKKLVGRASQIATGNAQT